MTPQCRPIEDNSLKLGRWLLVIAVVVLAALTLCMTGCDDGLPAQGASPMNPGSDLQSSATLISMVSWLYLSTNSARAVTYLPQVVAVWRCTDGARAISLLTWSSWVLANLTAVMYGIWVVRDVFFVAISAINLVFCATVTLIAARRRGLL